MKLAQRWIYIAETAPGPLLPQLLQRWKREPLPLRRFTAAEPAACAKPALARLRSSRCCVPPDPVCGPLPTLPVDPGPIGWPDRRFAGERLPAARGLLAGRQRCLDSPPVQCDEWAALYWSDPRLHS